MHPETLEYETQLQRNKGIRAISGKIIKGTLNQANIKLKVSSIPSKHQNNVYRFNSKPAFGDSTQKFYTPQSTIQNMTPGPGCYDYNKSISKIDSKKGSGFFASASKLQRLQRTLSHGPGPGTYRTISQKNLSLRQKLKSNNNKNESTLNSSKSTVQLSSEIQNRILFKQQLDDARQKPGIGRYNIYSDTFQKQCNSYAIFKSKVDRFFAESQIVPPVGTYQLNLNSNKNFSQRTKRINYQKIKSESTAQMQKRIENSIKNLHQKQQKERVGPGLYEPFNLFANKTFKIRENMHDRFGELKPIYKIIKQIDFQDENRYVHESNKTLSPKKFNSMFKSTTQRSPIKVANQMDPGKYNHKVQFTKKSHLINISEKWV